MIAVVVAMAENRVIGIANQLPWHLPADLRRFKQITLGKPVLMGRRTHESIGRVLPGRTNIVVSGNSAFEAPGCIVVPSVAAALDFVAADQDLMVIGGASIYRALLPYARRIHLTRIHARFAGDTFFPPLDPGEWCEVAREDFPADEENAVAYSWCQMVRRGEGDEVLSGGVAPGQRDGRAQRTRCGQGNLCVTAIGALSGACWVRAR